MLAQLAPPDDVRWQVQPLLLCKVSAGVFLLGGGGGAAGVEGLAPAGGKAGR